MTLKNILVHIDNSKNCGTRIDLAISLAIRHQARLTGLYVTPPSGHGYLPAKSNIKVKQLFNEKSAQSGIDSKLLCVTSAKVDEVVRVHAYYKDIVIIGQSDEDHGDRNTPVDLPERLIFGTGRPVLIVPFTGNFNSIGEQVVVAWRGGQESARTTNDALPFLKKANQVNVLAVNPLDIDGKEGKKVCSEICTHLACHGITAKANKLITKDIPIGDMLLNWTCDQGGDLMVLGAIAVNHLGNPSLGPVGRHILKHMTFPVLISH